MKEEPGQATPPEVVAMATKLTGIELEDALTKFCAGMVLVPLREAPDIPEGGEQVQLKLTPEVAEESVMGTDKVLEQMT